MILNLVCNHVRLERPWIMSPAGTGCLSRNSSFPNPHWICQWPKMDGCCIKSRHTSTVIIYSNHHSNRQDSFVQKFLLFEFFFPLDWFTGTLKPEPPTIFTVKKPMGFRLRFPQPRRAQDVSRLGLAHGHPGGPREFGGGATLYALPAGRCPGDQARLSGGLRGSGAFQRFH